MTETEGLWGVVEIMGHRTRAGMLSDAQLGGATFLRVEHPTLADHTGEGPLTELYSPSSIFAVRLCSQEEATKVAAWAWRQPQPDTRELPAALDDVDVDDDVVDVEILDEDDDY